jgi:hypothetical protein
MPPNVGWFYLCKEERRLEIFARFSNDFILFVGLYASIEFACNCSYTIKMNTSPQVPHSRHREINLRAATGKKNVKIGLKS